MRNALYTASIACVQRIAKELGRTPTVIEYREMRDEGACHPATLYQHGGWGGFLRDAGLRPLRPTGPKAHLCECGERVEYEVPVPCGGGTTVLLLCNDCYQLQMEVGR